MGAALFWATVHTCRRARAGEQRLELGIVRVCLGAYIRVLIQRPEIKKKAD